MVHIREKGGQAIAVCRLKVYKDSSLPNICYDAQGEGEREGEGRGSTACILLACNYLV